MRESESGDEYDEPAMDCIIALEEKRLGRFLNPREMDDLIRRFTLEDTNPPTRVPGGITQENLWLKTHPPRDMQEGYMPFINSSHETLRADRSFAATSTVGVYWLDSII
jgi:hypothetical protein